MRKIIYHVASSLDGCIAEHDGSFECFMPIEGEHVSDYLEALQSYGAVLMGRSTYEVGLKQGVTNPYPHMQSYVFSRTLERSPDENVELISGDAADFVRGLKNQPGKPIYLCGGGELAATLLEAKLIDEIVVKLNPLLIGGGIRMFPRMKKPVYLELTGSKVYNSGVVLLLYRVRG
jgi:dihydrofolate reductase